MRRLIALMLIGAMSTSVAALASTKEEREAAKASQRAEKESRRQLLYRAATRPIYCEGKDDCEIKWSKALQWVLSHSYYRLSAQTDMLIATFGPISPNTQLAYSISKVAQGNGRYEFDFRAGCANVFMCNPSLEIARADFGLTIMGPLEDENLVKKPDPAPAAPQPSPQPN